MNIIDNIKQYWGWTNIDPDEVIAVNDFGNLIIKDMNGKYWRLCPEEVYCNVIAESTDEYHQLINNDKFIIDWNMSAIVDEATKNAGALSESHFYYMVVPGIADGEYGGTNIKIAPLSKIIKFSGELGKQIKDLPDGSKIQFKPLS